MKKICACLVVAASLAIAVPSAQPVAAPDIRLVLLIAVDQFRYDYLTRFRSEYTDGFKRLLTEGAVFTNANLEHYPTVTAVGHATMLTGATPSVSGIIGNDWFDRETGATVDERVGYRRQAAGLADRVGRPPRDGCWSSTRRRRAEDGVAAGQGSARTRRACSACRLKDRSAILPVGRGADAAYWWDTKTGSFVTQHLLLRRAAGVGAARSTIASSPTPTPARSWTLARRPRHRAAAAPGRARRARSTTRSTAARSATSCSLDFASELLSREQLGTRNATDLLSVSFSSNDSVGHTYGPDSPQVRDIAIRTDRVIGRLLSSGRQERRTAAHARRVHDRSRRRARARDASASKGCPADA